MPLVTALALRDGRPFLIVRGKAKEYGTANRLEGVYEPGQRVLLVEDIVTSGGAALEAVFALREAGLVVETALCVLDREEGGRQTLAAVGITLHPLLPAGRSRARFGLISGISARSARTTSQMCRNLLISLHMAVEASRIWLDQRGFGWCAVRCLC